MLVVTVGQANPNKRIPSVIETLGRNPDLRDRVFYAVLGACDDAGRDALHALAPEHGLEDVVRITGRLPGDRLRAWLAQADLFVNLRYLAMESGPHRLPKRCSRVNPSSSLTRCLQRSAGRLRREDTSRPRTGSSRSGVAPLRQ